MKNSRIIVVGLLSVVGLAQASQQSNPSLSTFREITHKRVVAALERLDAPTVEKLLKNQGPLERPKRNELLLKIQGIRDSYENADSALKSKPDFWKVVAGGTAVAASAWVLRSSLAYLGRTAISFLQESSDPEEGVVVAKPTASEEDSSTEEVKDLPLAELAAFVCMVKGVRLLMSGFACTSAQESLKKARALERTVFNSSEVGDVPLNIVQD